MQNIKVERPQKSESLKFEVVEGSAKKSLDMAKIRQDSLERKREAEQKHGKNYNNRLQIKKKLRKNLDTRLIVQEAGKR